MMPKILNLSFAATLTLSAAVAAPADTSASGSAGQPSQSTQNPLGPVPAPAPQLSQPSAVQDSAKPVSKMANAEQKLTAARVQDMLGRPIGNIRSVHTSAGGTVTSAQVALNTQTEAGKTVTIPASQLMYDVHTGVVVAQLTQTEIDAMPATVAQQQRGY
jgi:hypothetical protein